MRGPGTELSLRKDIADKCRSCGSCRAVCPIFAEIGREDAAARGKVALIRAVLDGELGLTEIFDERVQLCLNCKACVDACPNDVRVDDLILSARSGLVEAGRLPFIKRFVFRRLLRRGRLLPPVGKTASFFQRFVLRGLPKGSPFRLLLPLVGIDRDRVFPQFARATFLETIPEVVPAPNGTARVAYFVGCAANLIYPESARAAVEMLNRAGVDVVVPKSQGCCGTPVFNAGDFVTAREMAARNIEALRGSGADAVVTACASCGLTLKREYEELLGFEDGVGMPVHDLTEYLALRGGEALTSDGPAEASGSSEPSGRVRVTYHDPCHLVRGQGVYEEPRQILRSIPWVEFVEMRDADRCCGGGGSFSLSHYDLSKAVARRKVEAIRDAGVDIVTTECQACVMQLSDMLAQAGMDVAVVSVAELAAQRGAGDSGQAGGDSV
ncbi:MAG: (Fe-S)-binding protein [Candidatus Eisenbacteria sp.]|jgi:glycolate oxidase iron-sulfur subunit|nr:(Fe-S)-binding protein [Candidatus Eisenbacteria bacterium]